MLEKMKTTKEVAESLGVHRKTVHRWINKGWLKAVRIGRAYYITEEELYNVKTFGIGHSNG